MYWHTVEGDFNTKEKTIEGLTVRVVGSLTPQKENYAVAMAEMYREKENDVLSYIAENIFRYYEGRYCDSKEELINMLGRVIIYIFSDDYGALTWLEHSLDEHIIECEFFNNLNLSSHITLEDNNRRN